MRIVRSDRFKKEYVALSESIQRRAAKQFQLLVQNPMHPSLRTRKIAGHGSIWEARVTRAYRFTFTIEKDHYVLRRIGTHEIYHAP